MQNTLLQKLITFIDKEANAQIEQVKEMWKLPLKQRVEAGEAIANVSIQPHDNYNNYENGYGYQYNNYARAARRFQSDKYIIRCPENYSKFRSGDVLRLHTGNPADDYDYIACKVIEDNGQQLVVESGFRHDLSDASPHRHYILDRDTIDIRFILKKALRHVEHQHLSIIENLKNPILNQAKFKKADQILRKLSLNPSQQEAFSKAYATDNFYLIQGPPGTGKTWVLAHLAATLAKEGERVLVTALSHRAINNALRKIYEATYYPRTIKIGQEYNAQELTWSSGFVRNYENWRTSPFRAWEKSFIVGSTVYALHTRKLQDVEFDTIIFDEAGQITLPLALAGMVRAKRYIFIGDHQQMQPVITAEYDEEETIIQSIFQKIHSEENSTMLNETYRMNAVINTFPSQHFYQNELESAPSAKNRKLELRKNSIKFSKILNPEIPSIFVDLAHKDKTIRCKEEAELAAQLVIEAVDCGVPPNEIAVVVPYRAQARLIKNHLYDIPCSITPNELKSIVVDTVERIQGQEREMIIISLTSSDAKYIAQKERFFLNPNRLNVAITRAKTKRIVIGSRHLFSAKIDDEKAAKALAVFKAFYQESEKVFLKEE